MAALSQLSYSPKPPHPIAAVVTLQTIEAGREARPRRRSSGSPQRGGLR